MLKRSALLLCALTVVLSLSACSSACKYETAGGVCGKETEKNGDYCFAHTCLFCSNPITPGSHYCDEHRCQFDIGSGRCDNGIIKGAKESELIYCSAHSSIEDLDEFKAALEVAHLWCNTTAANAKGTVASPFKFTGGFTVSADKYTFDVEDIDVPYKRGYVIVKRSQDGELECDGMRYN